MPVDVFTEIMIARPRDAVAAFASDPSNAPKWYVNMKSVEWQSAAEVVVGARAAFVAHFLGRRLAYTSEIVDAGDGTRMTLRNRGEPRGFSAVLGPLMAGAMRRANTKDLARLKQLLEAG